MRITREVLKELENEISKTVKDFVFRLRCCDCGKIYVERGRRRYCSPRCQKRVYMRAFRNPDWNVPYGSLEKEK